jgi:NTE family protein
VLPARRATAARRFAQVSSAMPESPIPVSLVLGSGGARGLAHIGVIRALKADGRYAIHAVTGTSIGALIGGLYAAGSLEAYADWVSGLSRADVLGLLDFSFTGRGLVEGERVMRHLIGMVGDVRIEDLPIPFTAVASDIVRRQEVWLTRGSLFEAIRASIAIPGLFTPAEIDGRTLVDGGLLSPLPLAPAQGHSTDRTIAVSLNGAPRGPLPTPPASPPETDDDPDAPLSFALLERLKAGAQRVLGPPKPATRGGALDTIARSVEAMQDRIARYQIAAYRPDLLIEVPVDACAVLDFHRAREMIALGERLAREALANDAARAVPTLR